MKTKLLFLFFIATTFASAQYDPLYSSVNTARRASLRGYEVGNNQVASVYGVTVFQDTSPELWYYSETSTATDNGTTILKPDSKTTLQAGRWLFGYKLPSPMGGLVTSYTGTTNASGLYTVTYGTAYATKPSVHAIFETTDPRDVVMLIASSTTGFTLQVQRRVDVLGLLPTYTNRTGAIVNALVTPN